MEMKAVVNRSGVSTERPGGHASGRPRCGAGVCLSPLSCGCVLAMIHRTKQHFIRAFREKRGFCHFTESFTLPGGGSTPLASPGRPSATLPSTWAGARGTQWMDEREILGWSRCEWGKMFFPLFQFSNDA